MAVEPDIVVAVAARTDGRVCVHNMAADRYPPRTFDAAAMPPVDPAQHHWSNYVLAAYQVRPPCPRDAQSRHSHTRTLPTQTP
jgi:galactokinase